MLPSRPHRVRRTGAPVVHGASHPDGAVQVVVEGPVHEGNVDTVWWAIELELEVEAPIWIVDLSAASMFAPVYYELAERCALLVGDRQRLELRRPAGVEGGAS